jgi:hexokinase
MHYSLSQLYTFSQSLTQEIKQAQKGIKNSLAFSRNILPTKNLVNFNENFQIIMMGGSHLESALMNFKSKSNLKISNFKETTLPKLENKELVCQIFLDHLEENVSVVCLNFAYPMKAILRDNLLDGVLISSPKEHKFEGLLNQTVGLELEKFVEAKTGRKIKVTVCNDTVALGLASVDYDYNFDYQNTVVGIVGTGYNFGFFEKKDVFVNLESGNFDKFEQSQTGKTIDSESTNPGKQLLEKEVGGAYLNKHFNLITGNNLKNTQQLSKLAELNLGEKDGLRALELIERASSLVAMQILALYNFKKELSLNQENFRILILLEGSLFWKGYKFYEFTVETLSRLGLTPDKYTITHFDKVGIKGAARLALLNSK